jgi:hypothetical protein
MHVTRDLNSFGEIIAHAQCSVDEKLYIYIPCVPHMNNCKKKFGSHDMKQRFLNNHCQECVRAYLSIQDCLSFLCEPNFFMQLFISGINGIYIYNLSSTENCAWAIITPKEFKSRVTCISFALLYWKTELSASNILRFALKICFWADF